MLEGVVDALLLRSGYNAALVAIGAALLGFAAGASGAFLFLRKRALVSDAIAHATLPGVAIAFIVLVGFGGDGRFLPALLIGSAVSAGAGLWLVEWMSRRTRLAEDAAIGAVLSVFFGFGVVLLTIIQTMPDGRQAGLETFLLGATAGMLFQDAVVIALGGALVVAAIVVLRRPMTAVAFDPGFAAASGVNVRAIDLMMMTIVMAVTVIGLKIVGLILIVAMLIIPPVAARFWTERAAALVALAGVIGAASAYLGAAISASAPKLPAGPIIVLVCFALFALSMLLAPGRGLWAALLRSRRFQVRVHRRQGLLALARGEPIFDRFTLKVLRRADLIRRDHVPTDAGRAQAARALQDEKRWELVRTLYSHEALASRYDALTPIEHVLTADEIVEIDRRIGGPVLASGGQ